MKRSAIIVEDDSTTAIALTKAIKSLGFCVRIAGTLQEARHLYKEDRPDLVLLDVSLPDGDGLDLMRDAPAEDDTQFVVVTGNLGQEVAVRSLRAKASDFLVKPVSLADLRDAVNGSFRPTGANEAGTTNGVKPGVLSDTLLTTTSHDIHHRSSLLLAGNSKVLRELEQTISYLAQSHANVVISGEAGVDKISAAYALHCANSRPGTIFHVQCATGHVLMGDKQIMDGFAECLEMSFSRNLGCNLGRNSGQRSAQAGSVTLILDDINLLNESRQRELLGYLTPRGLLNGQTGDGPRLVSIQRRPGLSVASGSNTSNKLLPDLCLCLYQSKLALPSLRQRKSDIVPIARKMLAILNAAKNSSKELSAESEITLEHYDWPGNLRELANVITDAFNKCSHTLNVEQVLSSPDDNEAISRSLEAIVGKTFWEVEKFLLQATLLAHNGNKKTASKTLGISLKTLYNRLNAYSIEY